MVASHYDQLRSHGLLSRVIIMGAVFRHSHYAYEEILLLFACPHVIISTVNLRSSDTV